MDTYDRVMLVVYDAIDNLNQSDFTDRAVKKGPDTVLLGSGGVLDPQGFHHLAGMVESRVERRFGTTMSLRDVATDRQLDAFTVSSLADAIIERIGAVAQKPAGDTH